MRGRLAAWARALKREVAALALALRDPEAPLVARLVALLVVAYALSPIDLIPDVIPVLGLLDDLVLVPAGIWLVLRLMPDEVMERAREQASTGTGMRPSRAAAVVIIALWLVLALYCVRMLTRFFA
uniref:YkvA family protein n=1 Tax=Stappia sp. TaxID=1870903 RepID=UPI003BA8B0B8